MRSQGKWSLLVALVSSVLGYGCASSDTATVEIDPGDTVSSAVGSTPDVTVPQDPVSAAESSKFGSIQMNGAYQWLAATVQMEVPRENGGGAIAIVRDGEVSFTRGFGVKSLDAVENGILSTAVPNANTIFGIGGISKTLTAIAVMQLVEARKISLNDSVLSLVPELGVSDPHGWLQSVTVQQLLTHTSGFSKGMHAILPAVERAVDAELDEYWTYLMALPEDVSIESFPGSLFHYSNNGYSLLGLVVERVARMPFATYMRNNVLVPLGMTRTTFVASDLKFLGNYATTGVNPLVHDTPHARPCGGAYSTALDLAKLGQFLMGANNSVLSPWMRMVMESRQTNTNWHLDAIWSGFGLYNSTSTLRWDPQTPYDSNATIFEVSGQWNNYASHLVMVPSKNFAYVMLNNENILPEKAARFAVEGIAKVGLTAYHYDGASVGRILGNYISESGRLLTVRKTLLGGGLILSEKNIPIGRGERFICQLIPLDKGLYDCADTTGPGLGTLIEQNRRFGWITFVPDSSGKVAYLQANTIVAKRAANLIMPQ